MMTQVFDRTATDDLSSLEEPVVIEDGFRAQIAVNAALDILATIGRSNVFKSRYGSHELTQKFTVPTKGGAIHVELVLGYEAEKLNVSVQATNAKGHSFSLDEPAGWLQHVNQQRGYLAPYGELKLEGGGAVLSWTQARFHS